MRMKYIKNLFFIFPLFFHFTAVGSPASSKNDELIKTYTPVISRYFRENGITYGSPVRNRDPFLVREKCGEKYHEYSIKSISFIRTEKKAHLFRVCCSGFDSCRKVLVTDEYRIKINISNSRITLIKLEGGER